jgi:hypothetical protein
MIFKGLGIQRNDQGLAQILSKRFHLIEGNIVGSQRYWQLAHGQDGRQRQSRLLWGMVMSPAFYG